jgi:uncharacterized protein YndB with AHSA1/START domain
MAMSFDEVIVRQRYYYDAGPDVVFKALTKPKKLVKWFLEEAKIKPKEGSSYTFTWEEGLSHTGKVERVVLDRSLVLSWPDTIKGKVYKTEVSFTLTKKGKGTLLEVVHTGFKEGPDWVWLYGAIQSGWAYYLTNLKSVLSEGVDLRSKYDNPSVS